VVGAKPAPPGATETPPAAPVAEATDRGRGQTSQKIFLLLCASLIHTLAGCVAAYVVIPIVEGVNGLAMGRHLVEPEVEPASAAQSFAALADHAQRLNDLLAETARFVATVAGSTGAFAQLGEKLTSLNTTMSDTAVKLGQAATAIGGTAPKLDAAAIALGKGAVALERSAVALETVPAKLEKPVTALNKAALSLDRLSTAAADAQRDLAKAATAIEGPARIMVKLLGSLLGLVKRVPVGLAFLGKIHRGHGQNLDRTAKSFDTLSGRLGDLVTKLDALSVSQGELKASLAAEIQDLKASSKAELVTIDDKVTELAQNASTLEATVKAVDTQLATLATQQAEQKKAVDGLVEQVSLLGKRVQTARKKAASATGSSESWVPEWLRSRRGSSGNHTPGSDGKST
jgi:chromosome segregation ATPase